jgi:hypothetical protein
MKKIRILFILSILSIFIACKKEFTPPAPIKKDLEIRGLVLDDETLQPIPNIVIRMDILSAAVPFKAVTVTDSNGMYNHKFSAGINVDYGINAYGYYYIKLFKKSNFYCVGSNDDYCALVFTPTDYNGLTTGAYTSKDTFYMYKAGFIDMYNNFSSNAVKDTVIVKGFVKKNGKKVDVIPEYKYYNDKSFQSGLVKTFANNMTYISWKLKSETAWHQDSVVVPFEKTTKFEIKY